MRFLKINICFLFAPVYIFIVRRENFSCHEVLIRVGLIDGPTQLLKGELK